MKRIISIVISIVILIIGIGAFIYISKKGGTNAPVSQNTTQNTIAEYSNSTYGYKFTYPSTNTIYEYAPELTSVGTSEGDSFFSIVDASIEQADRNNLLSTSIKNFNDFAYYSAKIYCDSDGPETTIGCTQVTRVEPFISNYGLKGQKIYLKKVITITSQFSDTPAETKTESSEVGPLYVFDISSSYPEKLYAALIIHNQLSNDNFSAADLDSTKNIALSLQINKR